MTYRGIDGKIYNIPDNPQEALATGGEGSIYDVDNGHVAKIYLNQVLSKETDLESKIRFMISNPPSRILKYMAWPIDALYRDGTFVGFVMNKLTGYSQLRDLYSFSISKSPSVDLRLIVALNLSNMVNEIHNAGYVIGDFNPKNIGYCENGTVCFYDNDSFQFKDGLGHLFKCGVNFEGYVAPEVMDETDALKRRLIREGKDASKVQMKDLDVGFTKDTDRFALAVHIFQLMFNGFNPYASIPSNEIRTRDAPLVSNASSSRIVPTAEENVRMDNYCFKDGRQPKSAAVPRIDLFPNYISRLFSESFRHLRSNEHRPSAQDWVKAINQYRSDVRQCGKQKDHIIWNRSSICPYCEAIDRFSQVTKQYSRPSLSGQSRVPASAVSTMPGPSVGFRNNATAAELQKFNTLYAERQSFSNKPITGNSLVSILNLNQHIIGLLSRYTLDPTEQSILNQCQNEINRIKQISLNPISIEIHLPKNDLEGKYQKILVSCPTTGVTGEYSFGDVCHIKLPRTDTYGRILDRVDCTISVQYYRKNQNYRYACEYSFWLNCDYSRFVSGTPTNLAATYSFDVVYCKDLDKYSNGIHAHRWTIIDHSYNNSNVVFNQNSVRVPLSYSEVRKEHPNLFRTLGIVCLLVFVALVWYMCSVSHDIIWQWRNTWERDYAGNWIYEPYYFGNWGPFSIIIGIIPLILASFFACHDFKDHMYTVLFVGGIGMLFWGAVTYFWNQFWPIFLVALISTLFLIVLNPFDKILNPVK